ncbi:PREDICTED: uncharacterized protein LOC18597481 [Theobroma cacao]|uniref:Uncharacterized protein LOC18597481 n=1 Tax=Theobroma cacao TaxID=3641 RepID=A0AB32V2M4_THECC|nr:PREDICTED: uncharacterized protein LOC18597481 [Theobroma cacao]
MIFLYMGEGMNEAMEKKRPRKLNFNAPLLSTRRPAGGHIGDELSCTNSQGGCKDSSNGIPFCWEQAPGKPKNLDGSNNVDDAETPRPKLPPSKWRPPEEACQDHNHDHDEGCDADVDDYDDDNNVDVFSDAMEVLSLTQAIDIVEKAEKFRGSSDGLKSKSLEPSDLDGLNLESLDRSDCPSPSFIIERFLPDATALAASSAMNTSLKTKLPYLCNYSESPCVSQAVINRPFSSPKGCGLEILLPWRMKHKLCGVKSPIKESSIIVKPTTSSKQKKLFSSIVAPSGEWRCK